MLMTRADNDGLRAQRTDLDVRFAAAVACRDGGHEPRRRHLLHQGGGLAVPAGARLRTPPRRRQQVAAVAVSDLRSTEQRMSMRA